MKKLILVIIFFLSLNAMLYFNYQSNWEQKETALATFKNQMKRPLAKYTPPSEISVKDLKTEKSQVELKSPFNDVNEFVEIDEISEELESEEKIEKDDKAIIKLWAIVKYSEKRLARLEVNNELATVTVGDEINGFLVENISVDKVVLEREGEEFVVMMRD